jgi:exodeoxyribonuclease-3
MKISTWNVNGIRARQAQLDEWATRVQPDVLCLQEIKASPDQLGLLADLPGYSCYWHGDKGYSGVALLVSERVAPTRPEFSHPPFDFERRIVTAQIGKLTVASVYVPNGGKDFTAKLEFLEALAAFAASFAATGAPLVLCGDLNVARSDMDIHPRERKPNAIGTRPDERAIFVRSIPTTRISSRGGRRGAVFASATSAGASTTCWRASRFTHGRARASSNARSAPAIMRP